MLINLSDVMIIPIYGVIHVGAHYGQEYDDYLNHGIQNMIFFEPVKSSFDVLIKKVKPSNKVALYNMALGNQTGVVEINKENQNLGMSNSILDMGTHERHYPHIKFTDREIVSIDKLDNVYFDRSKFNMLNIDVQGFELEVLKGAVKTLSSIDLIYTEINTEQVYKDCPDVSELDEFLIHHGFQRTLTKETGKGWGDAVYRRIK